MVVAAICGYVRQRSDDAQQFLKEENVLLQERRTFVTELYKEALESKNRYKKQIIGSKDSFGKIFDVVKTIGYGASGEDICRIHHRVGGCFGKPVDCNLLDQG